MMATKVPLDELVKRAVDLNVRYYSGLGQLWANYVKDLVTTIGDVTSVRPQTSQAQAAANPSAHKAQQTPVMVLEAEAGKEALGVFLVENHLSHDISTRVVPSAFFDESHNEVRPAFSFDPESVTLRPGEQVLVRLKVQIDNSYAADTRYLGYLNIPELTGTKVPIVLRRRPAAPEEASS
jgi:hypothetical protein